VGYAGPRSAGRVPAPPRPPPSRPPCHPCLPAVLTSTPLVCRFYARVCALHVAGDWLPLTRGCGCWVTVLHWWLQVLEICQGSQ
jgi:hypothetical protein